MMALIVTLSRPKWHKGEGGVCTSPGGSTPRSEYNTAISLTEWQYLSGGLGAGQAPNYNVLRSNTLPYYSRALLSVRGAQIRAVLGYNLT